MKIVAILGRSYLLFILNTRKEISKCLASALAALLPYCCGAHLERPDVLNTVCCSEGALMPNKSMLSIHICACQT